MRDSLITVPITSNPTTASIPAAPHHRFRSPVQNAIAAASASGSAISNRPAK